MNPVWLQLGTVAAGKRRRRDTSQQSISDHLHAHNLAYNGHRSQQNQ